MQLFYLPSLNVRMHTLNEEESRHCIRVMRMKSGEEVSLTDGKGRWCRAVIAAADPRACLLQITEHHESVSKRSPLLHMAVAPTKNIDRFEWFLEKATECGIDEITPIICEHSERTLIKHERMEKILVSAMKQSLRCWLPQLHKAVSFGDFIAETHCGTRLIAHCSDRPRQPLRQLLTPGSDALVLIGPEGDFTADEIAAAYQAGFRAVSFGEYRLRTETAALTACMGFNMINGLI